MTLPTINMDGASREGLIEALENACEAVRNARQAVAKTAPHERDYWPQGPAALQAAEREHWARMEKLLEVQRELEEMAIAICDMEERR